ncbi:hypothetical protein ACKVWL_007177 [Pyricularia oryzae]
MWPLGISGKIALVYITLSAFLCHAISAATGAVSSFSAATEARAGPFTLNKRAKILDTCTGQDREQLVVAMEHCRILAQAGIWGAKNYPEQVKRFFKTENPKDIKAIIKIYEKVNEACYPASNLGRITCPGPIKECPPDAASFTHNDRKRIFLCPAFFRVPTTGPDLFRYQDFHLLHEATQLSSVGNIESYLNEGLEGVHGLPSKRYNLKHADTYAYFALVARREARVLMEMGNREASVQNDHEQNQVAETP